MAAMRARLAALVEAVTTTERWAELMEESATKLVGKWRTRLRRVVAPCSSDVLLLASGG